MTVPITTEPAANTNPTTEKSSGSGDFMAALHKELGVEPPKKSSPEPEEGKEPEAKNPPTSPASGEEPEEGAPAPDPEADPNAGKPDAKGKQKDPKDEELAQLKERLKVLEGKQTEPKKEEPKHDPSDIRTYTDAQIEEGIAHWSKNRETIENADVLIAKATKELSRRGVERENAKTKDADAFEAKKKEWDGAIQPQYFWPLFKKDEAGKVVADHESELFNLAAGAYKELNLKGRADGGFRALQWAMGVLAMNGKLPANNFLASPGSKPNAQKAPPPAMKGAPAASGTTTAPGKDAAKAKEVKDSTEAYTKSKSLLDLERVIKAKLK